MTGWTAVTFNIGATIAMRDLGKQLVNFRDGIEFDFNSLTNNMEDIFYFASPSSFAGSRINSHGLEITYTITQTGNIVEAQGKYTEL